jgi:hypothetical protein
VISRATIAEVETQTTGALLIHRSTDAPCLVFALVDCLTTRLEHSRLWYAWLCFDFAFLDSTLELLLALGRQRRVRSDPSANLTSTQRVFALRHTGLLRLLGNLLAVLALWLSYELALAELAVDVILGRASHRSD